MGDPFADTADYSATKFLNFTHLEIFMFLSVLSIDLSVGHFRLFPNCHLKFIFIDKEVFVGRIDYLISKLIQANINISVSSFTSSTCLHRLVSSNNRSAHAALRFTQCFLHVYMEDELTNNGQEFTSLLAAMKFQSQQLREWPQHFLFFGNFANYSKFNEQNQKFFYRNLLPKTFARGLIITVSHDQKLMIFSSRVICIICEDTFKAVHIRQAVPPSELQFQSDFPSTINSRLAQRKVYLLDRFAEAKTFAEQGCDVANPAFRPPFAHMHSSICIYHILSSFYNVTIGYQQNEKIKEEPTKLSILMNGYMRLTYKRYQDNLLDGLTIAPFNLRTLPLKYSAFQEHASFTGATLVKPFEWTVWLTGLIILVLLTVIISLQKFPKSGRQFINSLFTLVRITLSQPLIPKSKRKNSTFYILMSWLIAMLVLSEAYKGMILSFLTKPNTVEWPGSLVELVGHSSTFPIFDFETIKRSGPSGSIMLAPLLQRTFELDQNMSSSDMFYGKEYRLLRQATIYNPKEDPVGAAAGFLRLNNYGTTIPPGSFKIGNEIAKKFAYLNMEFTESFIPLILSLFPDVVASDSVEVPGLSLSMAWFSSKGFLFDWFSNTLGRLVASGFLYGFQNHWKVWSPCSYLHDVLVKLKTVYNVTDIMDVQSMPEVRKCLRMVLSGKIVGGTISPHEENATAAKLTMRQFGSIFLLFLYSLVGTVIMLMLELARIYGKPQLITKNIFVEIYDANN